MAATLTPQEAITRGLPKPSACDMQLLDLAQQFAQPESGQPPRRVRPRLDRLPDALP